MNKKYVTLKDGGCDFRKLAKIMTHAGYKMNHATARNQLMFAIREILQKASKDLCNPIGEKQIKQMINDQDLQDNFGDVVFAAYKELEREENEKRSKRNKS
jgi:hypothetical protein